MKANILEYRGYHTKIEFDSESYLLIGKIEGISDFVDFKCADANDIEKEFHAAVDDYLEFCMEVGKEPEKEYKGTFNIRIKPELHRKLALLSSRNGETLNASVEKAIQEYVSEEKVTTKTLEKTMSIIANSFKPESKNNQYTLNWGIKCINMESMGHKNTFERMCH